MATFQGTGTGTTGASSYTLQLVVNEDSYSIANNTSSVSWALYLISTGYNFSTWSFPITASVDGEVYNVNENRTIARYSTLTIASGSKTITHSTDGTKSISCSASCSATAASYLPGNISVYGTVNLTNIPRYPSGLKLSVASKTATTVTMNWSANESCSKVQYKLGSGGSWVDVTGSGTSGSYTISGLTPGNTYTIYGDFKRADSGLWSSENNDTPSTSVALYNVGKITSAPNFNDEANPTIQYTNEAGNTVTSLQACISLTGATDNIAYRDIPKTGNSYTFNLTTAERNTLRNATTGTSRTVKFYIKTVAGGNTYFSSVTKTLSIINANPTFSTFNFLDTGIVSTELTGNPTTYGNSRIIIDNFNVVKIIIYAVDKATANKRGNNG